MLKSLKNLIHLSSLATMSILFFALWQNPKAGFTPVAAVGIGCVLATQWCIQKACRISRAQGIKLKAIQVLALVVMSLSFSTTSVLAGVEYGGLKGPLSAEIKQARIHL